MTSLSVNGACVAYAEKNASELEIRVRGLQNALNSANAVILPTLACIVRPPEARRAREGAVVCTLECLEVGRYDL